MVVDRRLSKLQHKIPHQLKPFLYSLRNLLLNWAQKSVSKPLAVMYAEKWSWLVYEATQSGKNLIHFKFCLFLPDLPKICICLILLKKIMPILEIDISPGSSWNTIHNTNSSVISSSRILADLPHEISSGSWQLKISSKVQPL